jgi:hypothetical protein
MRFNKCLKSLIAESVLSVNDARHHKLVETMAKFMDKGDLKKLLRSFKIKLASPKLDTMVS